MTELTELLPRFERALRAQGAGVVDHLAPGVGRERVEEVLGSIGLVPTAEVLDWFAWHDGTSATAGPSSSVGAGLGQVLSLDEAVEEWRLFRDLGVDEPGAGYPDATYLPIITSVGGDAVVARCSAEEPVRSRTTRLQMVEPVPEDLWLPSLAEPVTWWVELLETGRWQFTEPGVCVSHVDRGQAQERQRIQTGLYD